MAEVGVVYPEGWRPRDSDAHYGIAELLESSSAGNGERTEDFLAYLRSEPDRTVLLSSEALSNWLPEEGRRESLTRFLLAAHETMPVTCLWTLRRADCWATSMYLHLVETGRPVPPPAEYFAAWVTDVSDVVTGLCELDRALSAVGGSALYRPYDRAGAHHGEMLRAVGLPDALLAEIEHDLRAAPRRNRRLTRKEAIALLHADALAARAGRGLSTTQIRDVLRGGDFEFAGDAPCELVGTALARAVHVAALEVSRGLGFEPYADFFATEEVEAGSPTPLEPEALSDDDVNELVACLEAR